MFSNSGLLFNHALNILQNSGASSQAQHHRDEGIQKANLEEDTSSTVQKFAKLPFSSGPYTE